MTLPLSRRYEPMEARLVDELPTGADWQYEPKWDGFRCLAYRDGAKGDLMSKAGKPLARYFPGLVETISGISPHAEPSPAHLRQLSELVQERGITTVFPETLAGAYTLP